MLNQKEKKLLKARAHKLKPVVLMGAAGLTDAIIAAIEEALDHHELIKVKITADSHEERDITINTIIQTTSSELVQRVGNIVTIYRLNPDKKSVKKH